MKRLNGILNVLMATLMMVPPVHGATRVVDMDEANGSRSFEGFAQNAGWEQSTLYWSASGGTYGRGSVESFRGDYSGNWDSSGASQTLTASVKTKFPKNQNGIARLWIFQTGATAPTHKLQVVQGSSVLNEAVISTVQDKWVKQEVSFAYPSSGAAPQVRLISVAADEPNIRIDNLEFGLNDGLIQVSQASLVGSAFIANTASCYPSRTSSALGAFTADADCPGPTVEMNTGPGVIQTTDTDLPRFTVNNLPAGDYEITMSSYVNGNADADMTLAINDGTNTRGNIGFNDNTLNASGITVVANFSYSTTSNISFELYGSSNPGSLTLFNGQGNTRIYFSIRRFPSNADLAVSSQNQKAPTIKKFTALGAATYTKPSGVVMLRIKMIGGGGGGAGSGSASASSNGTSGTNSTFGTSLLTSGAGNGANWSGSTGGSPGSGTVNSPAISVLAYEGQYGKTAPYKEISAVQFPGGEGGHTAFGRGGVGVLGSSGGSAGLNTGAGGAGGGASATGGNIAYYGGSGGGAAGYLEALIINPDSSYPVFVGAGGTGGAAGTNGTAGQNGGSGVIIVEEFYSFANVPVLIGSLTPTVQKFPSGSGTYFRPSPAPKYLRVKMVGGGGGGAVGGTSNGAGGGVGGNTTFGTSLLTATGGTNGTRTSTCSSPGSGTVNSPAIGTGYSGSFGERAVAQSGVTSTAILRGGLGGAAIGFGGGGGGGSAANTGAGIAATYGGGGGGGGGDITNNSYSGAGGCAAGSVDAIIPNPSESYSYSVGAGGVADTGAVNGGNGGAGGSGYIEVTEFYQ